MNIIKTLDSINEEYKSEFDIDLNHHKGVNNENGFEVFKNIFIQELELLLAIYINSIKPEMLKHLGTLMVTNIKENQAKYVLNDFRLARYNHYETMDYVLEELRPNMSYTGILRSAVVFNKDINTQLMTKKYLEKIQIKGSELIMRTNSFTEVKPAKDWLLSN